MISFTALFNKRRQSSPCARTWTQQTSSFTGSTWIDWVYYGNGVWVACGDGAKLATSTDGASWTQRTSGFTADTIRGGCYGNSVYVNVGSAAKLFTATDPTSTWTSRTSGYGGGEAIYDVSYDGSTYFVTCGDAGKIFTATDPTSTWTNRLSAGSGGYALCYNGSIWVCGFAPLGGNTIVYTATDPTSTWTQRTVVSSNAGNVYGVAYGNSIWVAVGANAANEGKLWTAPDPTSTWTERTSSFGTSAIYEVVYGNGCFLACAADGKMATSSNGTDWTQVTDPSFSTTNIYGLACDGTSRWVATGSADKLATSDV